MSDFRQFKTVQQTAAETGGTFTEAGLRWLLFNGRSNGFDSCVVRVGRRVLIDGEKFSRWLEAQSKSRQRAA